jgi:hypothetical protein
MVAAQLFVLLLVVRAFRLMPSAAWNVLQLGAVGFVVHASIPRTYRHALFIALSVGVVVSVLGWASGGQLLAIGLLLTAICQLPLTWGVRVAMLVAIGALLTVGRAGLVELPVGEAVWPILGSIFMFRLIVYMYDIRHNPELGTWTGALSYFFLLPNPVFPFFPVVDYKTFQRTWYDTEASRIYQTGIAWMVRGVVHLILYRFVYYYLTIAPEDVQTSGQLVRFVVSNYGLYLRVSGTFHLIVGMLHLFGYNLPVSNNLYFLASSFTDYWRRVNIYWKDFMMKVFYYPSYFALRRAGSTAALVLATVAVFVATTILHSYQWFWLRGDWYLSPMDLVFWTVLGVLVIGNVVRESKKGRKRTLSTPKWTLKETAGRMVSILLTFTIISSLWSLWSAPSLREWFGMWSVWNVGAPFSGFTAALLALGITLLVAGSWFLSATLPGKSLMLYMKKRNLRESPYLVLGTLALLLILGDSRVRAQFDSGLLLVVEDLQHDRLSRGDQEQLERGYYENLFSVEQTNPELAELYSQENSNWVSLWRTEAVSETGDLLRLELLPSVEMLYKGQPFTTNEWGMRDRGRTLLPLPGTYRFAVLGASTTMGSGVNNEEPYPLLVENLFAASSPQTPVEFMNFAVESYNAVEQVGVVDQRIGRFAPHGLLYIAHETEFEKTVNSLANMVENRTDLGYDELKAVVARAGVEPGTPRTMALRQLGAHREEIIDWAYRRIAAQSVERGVLPVWVFVPMPVPGTGPCPPGSAQLFCFGNLSRAGAAADASDPRVERLFQIARDAGFVVLDLSNVYGDADLKALWIAETDGHPNATGHKMVADGLFAALRSNGTVTQHVDRITKRSDN